MTMKPRSLFDNPDAWVNATFKKPPRPRSFVTLPKPRPKPEPRPTVRKVAAEPPVHFPPSEQAMPYQTGYSPVVRQTIQAVAAMAGVPMGQIVGERRTGEVAIVRHIAVWIARKFTNRSLIAIASEVGGRHHTTIMHGIRCVDKLIEDLGIKVPEETPEAWTGALLAAYAAQKRQQSAAYWARQKILKSERDRRRRLRDKGGMSQ
jgi:hypothetical protein